MTYEAHPAAMLFPMLPEAELRELAEDIKAHGQLDPIVIYEAKILDGRNRYAACELIGVEPKLEFANGNIPSPVQFVISKNLHRRQLTQSQRAAVGAKMLPLLEEEARKRQEATRAKPGEQIGTHVTVERRAPMGESTEIVGKMLGVGGATVGRAKAVLRDDPETFAKIERGEITVNAAYDGHKEQPKHGGQQPVAITTKRGEIIAEAHKRRMFDALSTLGGICSGFPTLRLDLITEILNQDEISTWATKAEVHAGELRRLASNLRKAKS